VAVPDTTTVAPATRFPLSSDTIPEIFIFLLDCDLFWALLPCDDPLPVWANVSFTHSGLKPKDKNTNIVATISFLFFITSILG